jgi:type IV secretion system protein VirB4
MKSSAQAQRNLRRGDVPGADMLPFGALVAHNVCKLRGQTAYCATWRMSGISFETATAGMVDARMAYLASAYRNMGGGELSYWYHRIGRHVRAELSHPFEGFARRIDDTYTAWQAHQGYALNESYITLVYRAPTTRAPKLWFGKSTVSAEVLAQEHALALAHFKDKCDQFEGVLKDFGPQRLGVFSRHGREFSELATFYGFLVNGAWREEALYAAPLCKSLPGAYLHFADLTGRLQINSGGKTRHAGMLDIVDYPPVAVCGDFNPLLALGVEFIETHSFTTLTKHEALGGLERQENQMISGEESSDAEMHAMADAKEEVKDGRIVAGTYHFSLALFGDDAAEVQAACTAVRREMPSYKLEDVRLVPESAWFAQLPGNWDYRPRTAFMTSRNFAGFAPMHTHPTGKANGNPWGEAVAILRGNGNQPFYFNFHAPAEGMDRLDQKDPGNTVIFGVIGAGKTATALFLIAQAMRYRPRVLFLDKDRGAEIMIRALGGAYTVFQRGTHTGLNPFQWPDSDDTRALCRRMVEACVKRGAQVLEPKDELDIGAAVASVFNSLPLERRRLAAVNLFLPGGPDSKLSLALGKWINNGYAAWVLDSPHNTIDPTTHRLYGIDYTVFLDDDEIREPVMIVLLALRDALIDGTPFISAMDEFWKAYSIKAVADDDKNKQKTGRKQSMLNLLITQSVSDALAHDHARTIIEQCVTKIFLPNPDAERSDYIDGLGLTDREFELVKGMGQYSRKMLVRQSGQSTVINMDLSGLSDELIALSGSLDNVAMLDTIRARVGNEPDTWIPALFEAVKARKAGTPAEGVH